MCASGLQKSIAGFCALLACLTLILIGPITLAEEPSAEHAIESTPHYLARISLHTPEEIEALLDRAAALIDSGDFPQDDPIAFILHGPEVDFFQKKNYLKYKSLIDKAAKLDAFNVVDIKICETAMRLMMIDRASLPAFVETVPYGPAEEDRLRRNGYVEF